VDVFGALVEVAAKGLLTTAILMDERAVNGLLALMKNR
jgi:hypothetical protein